MQSLIIRMIQDFVREYPEIACSRTSWREPVVAFAAAGDELFRGLRGRVSAGHALPGELLDGARTVICYFLPYAEAVAISNIQGRQCSWEWGVAFNETNKLIVELNTFLLAKLGEWGYKGSFTPATHNLDESRLVSDWSHRHVAFIAGLGTFGLNNMLITEQGCCGRLGTLVTTMPIQPTVRSGRENCLHKGGKSCRACVDRCVNGSLTESGFDRHACYAMCLANERPELGIPDICGKCTVNVPCSQVNPAAAQP